MCTIRCAYHVLTANEWVTPGLENSVVSSYSQCSFFFFFLKEFRFSLPVMAGYAPVKICDGTRGIHIIYENKRTDQRAIGK
jgi:hypothetical protein